MKKLFLSAIIIGILVLNITTLQLAVAVTENSWTNKTTAPITGNFKAATADHKIYLLGNSTNYEYNPSADTWTIKNPMPTPRTSFAIASCQNKIYVIGGVISSNPNSGDIITCSINEVYDPLTDTWETKAPMPTSRSYMEANTVNNRVYVIGGRMGAQYTTSALNQVYDPTTDSWSTNAPIPYQVVNYASAVIENKIYVVGGQDEFLNENMNVAFNQIYDTSTNTWSQGAQIPSPTLNAASSATTGTMAPKRIYVISGDAGFVEPVNQNYRYDPENNSCHIGTPMSTSRYGLTLTVENDLLYTNGGTTGWLSVIGAVEEYTPSGYGTVSPSLPSQYSSPSPSSRPSHTPNPTSSQTINLSPSVPEFPSWMILIVLFAVVVFLTVFRKRMKSMGEYNSRQIS